MTLRSEFRHGKRVPLAPATPRAHSWREFGLYAIYAFTIILALYSAFATADRQFAVADRINQENIHAN